MLMFSLLIMGMVTNSQCKNVSNCLVKEVILQMVPTFCIDLINKVLFVAGGVPKRRLRCVWRSLTAANATELTWLLLYDFRPMALSLFGNSATRSLHTLYYCAAKSCVAVFYGNHIYRLFLCVIHRKESVLFKSNKIYINTFTFTLKVFKESTYVLFVST